MRDYLPKEAPRRSPCPPAPAPASKPAPSQEELFQTGMAAYIHQGAAAVGAACRTGKCESVIRLRRDVRQQRGHGEGRGHGKNVIPKSRRPDRKQRNTGKGEGSSGEIFLTPGLRCGDQGGKSLKWLPAIPILRAKSVCFFRSAAIASEHFVHKSKFGRGTAAFIYAAPCKQSRVPRGKPLWHPRTT